MMWKWYRIKLKLIYWEASAQVQGVRKQSQAVLKPHFPVYRPTHENYMRLNNQYRQQCEA